MIGLNFIDTVAAKLASRGYLSDWNADQLATVLQGVMQQPYVPPRPPQLDRDDLLDNIPNQRLIHEMLKRGFAVMRVPDAGKPKALETA